MVDLWEGEEVPTVDGITTGVLRYSGSTAQLLHQSHTHSSCQQPDLLQPLPPRPPPLSIYICMQHRPARNDMLSYGFQQHFGIMFTPLLVAAL